MRPVWHARAVVPRATVLRGGQRLSLPSRELVPGDVVVLEEGGHVPADSRLLRSAVLRVDESALTGESADVGTPPGVQGIAQGDSAQPSHRDDQRQCRIGGYRVRRIVAIGAVLLAAVGAWAGRQSLGEPGRILDRAVRYFRGPDLPVGFASGNGRIEATEYDIGTKRAGRIATVPVAEGDMVQVGQVLARMDTLDLEADLREAQAQATQAREDRRRAVAAIAQRQSELRGAAAAVAQRQSELRRADAAIAQRQGELDLAHKELQRTQMLFAKDLIARQKSTRT